MEMNMHVGSRVSSRPRAASLVVAALLCAGALTCAPASASATSFSWSGAGSSPNWSEADNWSPGGAPGGTADTLDFENIGGACDAGTAGTACYDSLDDVGPLTASGLTIDDNSPYVLGPSGSTDTLTLGAGGIEATSSDDGIGGPAQIDIPIQLEGDQTWDVDGGGEPGQGISVAQASGQSRALELNLNNGGTLYATALSLGSLMATGDGSGYLVLNGTDAHLSSGSVTLDDGTSLIDLAPGATSSQITLDTNSGPDGFLVAIGGGGAPDGTLTITGSESLDPETTLSLDVDDNGSTPSSDFSQLTATGGIAFGGAAITLTQGNTSSGGCATLTPGETYTLVSSQGPLTGELAYLDTDGNTDMLSQGQTSAPTALAACTDDSTTITTEATLTYGAKAITATVLEAPQSVAVPNITGTPDVTETLTADPGNWSSDPAPAYTYQWVRCSHTSTSKCSPLAGATASTLKLTRAYLGDEIRVQVTATNSAGTASAESRSVGPVEPSHREISSALTALTHPSGRRAIAALLRRRSFRTRFRAPDAGALRDEWTTTVQTGTRRHGRHGRHRTIAVAIGRARVHDARTVELTIHLTSAGRRLLRNDSRLAITATARLRLGGGDWTSVRKRFTL